MSKDFEGKEMAWRVAENGPKKFSSKISLNLIAENS